MKKIFVVILILMVFVTVANAELKFNGWAPKVGYNFDSEDISLGADINLNTIAKDIYFVPQVEFDFLGDLKKFGVGASFQYFVNIKKVDAYFGTGADIIYWDYDNDFAEANETDFKLHFLGGFQFNITKDFHMFTQVKTRFIDNSDTTLWFGVYF
jgi:hypothetical protein